MRLTFPPCAWTRVGEAGHLGGRQDPIEVRADRDAVMAIEVRELPVRRRGQVLDEAPRRAVSKAWSSKPGRTKSYVQNP